VTWILAGRINLYGLYHSQRDAQKALRQLAVSRCDRHSIESLHDPQQGLEESQTGFVDPKALINDRNQPTAKYILSWKPCILAAVSVCRGAN
jgi:hypothetical protein